ncbi:hypothetical protein BH10PSE18_BH10PSE18_08120 [soil metagenome]
MTLPTASFDLELSWLVYKASRDTWMDDAEHQRWKRVAWTEANEMARQNPADFARLPAALTDAMTTTRNHSAQEKHHVDHPT